PVGDEEQGQRGELHSNRECNQKRKRPIAEQAGGHAVNQPAASVPCTKIDFWGESPILVEPSTAQLTSDTGLLPLRQFDEHIGLTQQFADCLDDPRNPDLCAHTFLEMVRCRVFGILAAYEDQNDHDALRYDPVSKLLARRLAAPKASAFGQVGQ